MTTTTTTSAAEHVEDATIAQCATYSDMLYLMMEERRQGVPLHEVIEGYTHLDSVRMIAGMVQSLPVFMFPTELSVREYAQDIYSRCVTEIVQ